MKKVAVHSSVLHASRIILSYCVSCLLYFGLLLPPVLLHGQDLHHSDEDVDEVQLEVNGLVDRVLGHEATLSHAGVVEDLLHVVQCEATEDGETTVQPNVLSPHQCARSGSGDDHGGKTGKCDDSDTSEEGATEVHVLVCLGSSTDEGERAHQTSSVESGACEDGGVHEEERGEEGTLGDVEGGPEGVLLHVAGIVSTCFNRNDGVYSLLRAGSHSAVHGTNASNKTNTHDHPWVGRHEPERPAVHVQSARSNTDHTNAETSVHECVVEVGALEGWHATILTGLAVEDQVDA